MFTAKGKGSENTKKTRRLSKEEKLIDSIFYNGRIETEELNEKSDKVEKPEDAAVIIK